MGITALVVLVVGALVIGVVSQFIGEAAYGYEWVITALAAFIGGYLAGQYLGPVSAWGPLLDGLYLVPALIGGVILAGVAMVVVRATRQPAT